MNRNEFPQNIIPDSSFQDMNNVVKNIDQEYQHWEEFIEKKYHELEDIQAESWGDFDKDIFMLRMSMFLKDIQDSCNTEKLQAYELPPPLIIAWRKKFAQFVDQELKNFQENIKIKDSQDAKEELFEHIVNYIFELQKDIGSDDMQNKKDVLRKLSQEKEIPQN